MRITAAALLLCSAAMVAPAFVGTLAPVGGGMSPAQGHVSAPLPSAPQLLPVLQQRAFSMRRAAQPVALFESIGPGEVTLGILAALTVAGVVSGIGPTTVVPILLILLSGDPDEREAAGKNENAAVKTLIENYTPSAWKKAYLGDNGVERDSDGEPVLLDLPAWQGDEARALVEPEAVANVKSMQLATIDVPSLGPVDTCYLSLRPEPEKAVDAPPVLLIHGFDSSVLEFRYVAPQLVEAGLRVEAMEWWTGGFTARRPFLEKLERDGSSTPWELIRDHQFAYWQRQLGGEKAVVLGASLGGAVAMDFAARYPECVEALILMDAGGESYAQPDPILTALAADPVVNLFQWRANNGLLPYPYAPPPTLTPAAPPPVPNLTAAAVGTCGRRRRAGGSRCVRI